VVFILTIFICSMNMSDSEHVCSIMCIFIIWPLNKSLRPTCSHMHKPQFHRWRNGSTLWANKLLKDSEMLFQVRYTADPHCESASGPKYRLVHPPPRYLS
jgi:hypothetical protein